MTPAPRASAAWRRRDRCSPRRSRGCRPLSLASSRSICRCRTRGPTATPRWRPPCAVARRCCCRSRCRPTRSPRYPPRPPPPCPQPKRRRSSQPRPYRPRCAPRPSSTSRASPAARCARRARTRRRSRCCRRRSRWAMRNWCARPTARYVMSCRPCRWTARPIRRWRCASPATRCASPGPRRRCAGAATFAGARCACRWTCCRARA